MQSSEVYRISAPARLALQIDSVIAGPLRHTFLTRLESFAVDAAFREFYGATRGVHNA